VGGRLECPCGRAFERGEDYEVSREGGEYLIECGNPECPLRVLGELDAGSVERGSADASRVFKRAFVTWNSARLGLEKTLEILSEHLSEILSSLRSGRQ